MRTNGWDMIQGKGDGAARDMYAFFERRRLIFARRHILPRALTQGQQLTGHDFMGLPTTTGYEVGNFKGCPDCG